MCSINIKYSNNNIFLTVLINNLKIYFKSTGQFQDYKKGKRKVSNFALLHLINDFFNFFFLNFKKKKFSIFLIKFFGCNLKRFFFLKYHIKKKIVKLKFKYLLFSDTNFPSFNAFSLFSCVPSFVPSYSLPPPL